LEINKLGLFQDPILLALLACTVSRATLQVYHAVYLEGLNKTTKTAN
jgi:hypothetical protein